MSAAILAGGMSSLPAIGNDSRCELRGHGDLRPLGSPRQRDFGGVLSIGLRRCQIPLLEITTQLKSQIATMAGPVDLGKYLPHL